ncbi:putative lipoprotein [Corallococcus macrosporus]|uniref:Putative lipoprotein n=2 Tax=Myxococcaceae TaxID=31 RepID=F8CBN2_MYXFH|nr:putative lipoprotein [Corallococcus macrosporus]
MFVMNTERYFTAVGVALRSKDMSSSPPEVLLRTSGGFNRITGTPHNGGYRFLGVPQGEFYLRTGGTYILTDERHVEIGRNILGRADTVYSPRSSTPLHLNLTNLAPWQQSAGLTTGSRIQLVSGSVDFTGDALISDAISTGATELNTQNAIAAAMTNLVPVFEAAKGDGLYVNQHATVYGQPLPLSNARLAANSLVRSLQVPAFDFTADDITPLAISGALQDVPTSEVSFEWRLGAYTPHASNVHPSASPRIPSFFIDVAAHGPEAGWVGYSGEILSFALEAGAAFTLTNRLPYGNPYPSSWRLVASATYPFRTMEVPPGGGPAIGLSGSIASTDYLENLVAGPIIPRLTPPRALSIDGIPATSQRVVGNTSPVISWQPPANGAPTTYRVRLYRLDRDGGFVSVMPQNTFFLPGTATDVRLPPGLLAPNTVYSVRVMAMDSPNFDFATPLYTNDQLPVYSADTVSSFFSTP